jgi:hypothetical protein
MCESDSRSWRSTPTVISPTPCRTAEPPMQEPQLGSAGRELEEAERGAEVAEALSTAVFIARAYQTQTLVAVHRRALRAGADADADGAVGGYLYDDLGEVQRREHLLDRALQEPALLRGQGGAATGGRCIGRSRLGCCTGRSERERRTARGPRAQSPDSPRLVRGRVTMPVVCTSVSACSPCAVSGSAAPRPARLPLVAYRPGKYTCGRAKPWCHTTRASTPLMPIRQVCHRRTWWMLRGSRWR